MDPLTAIGAVASIAQLAQTAISLSKTLYSLGAALASASDDIRALADDLKTFAQSLTLLSRLLEDSKSWYSDDVYLLTAKIIKDCAELYVKIDKILIKLGGNGKNKWKTRLKFVYKEGEIRKLMKRLRDMKGTLATILMSLQVDLQLSLLNISSASKLQRAPDRPLLPETIDSLKEAQKAVEASKAMSHDTICSEQVVRYSEKSFAMISSRVEELTGTSPLTDCSRISVCLKEPTQVVPRSLDAFEGPKAPNKPSSYGILSSSPQIAGKAKQFQGANRNDISSSRFHPLAFIVQPQMSNNDAFIVPAKSKTKSLKSSSSSESFKSALSEQDISNDLAQEIKAVQSVMHAFRTALELVGKLIDNRIAKHEEDLYFAARDLESSLADGETEIKETHKSHCKQHGHRYIESFTDSHKTELQSISSVLMRKVVTVLHIYSADHEDLQKSKLESLYWCSERCRGHTLNQILQVASTLRTSIPVVAATENISDETHFASKSGTESSLASFSPVSTSELPPPLKHIPYKFDTRGISPIQSESDTEQHQVMDLSGLVQISRTRRARRPKVKTGCNNCRNRSVKCDETRPICLKCVRSGRQCDGYPAYRRTAEVAVPTAQVSLQLGSAGAVAAEIGTERKKMLPADLLHWEDRLKSTGAPLHRSFKERAIERQGRIPSPPCNNEALPGDCTNSNILESRARKRLMGSGVQDPMPEMGYGEDDSDATTNPSIIYGSIEEVQAECPNREPNSIEKVHRHPRSSTVSLSSHNEPLERTRRTLRERPYELERYSKTTEYSKRPDASLRPTVIRQRPSEPQQIAIQNAPPLGLPHKRDPCLRPIIIPERAPGPQHPLPNSVRLATEMGVCGTAQPAGRNQDEEYYYRRDSRELEASLPPLKLSEAKPDAASKTARWPINKRSSVSDDPGTNFGRPRVEIADNGRRYRSYYTQSAVIGSSGYEDAIRLATSYQDDVAGAFIPLTAEILLRQNSQQASRSRMTNSRDSIITPYAPNIVDPRKAGTDILNPGLASAAVAGLYETRRAKKDQVEDNSQIQGSGRRSRSTSRSRGPNSDPGLDPQLGMVEYGVESVYPTHRMNYHNTDYEGDHVNIRPRSRSTRVRPSSSFYNDRYGPRNRSPSINPARASLPWSAGAAAIGINQHMERKAIKEAEREQMREEPEISKFRSASYRISNQRNARERVVLVPSVDHASSDGLVDEEPVNRLPEHDKIEPRKLIGGLRRVSPPPENYETSDEDPFTNFMSDSKSKRGALEAIVGGLAGNLIENEAPPISKASADYKESDLSLEQLKRASNNREGGRNYLSGDKIAATGMQSTGLEIREIDRTKIWNNRTEILIKKEKLEELREARKKRVLGRPGLSPSQPASMDEAHTDYQPKNQQYMKFGSSRESDASTLDSSIHDSDHIDFFDDYEIELVLPDLRRSPKRTTLIRKEMNEAKKGKRAMPLGTFLNDESLGSWNNEIESLPSSKPQNLPMNQSGDNAWWAEVKMDERSMVLPQTDILTDRHQDFDFDSFLHQDLDELDPSRQKPVSDKPPTATSTATHIDSPMYSSMNATWRRLSGSKVPSWTSQQDEPFGSLLPVEGPPNSVNSKQFERIRKRRIARQELEMKFAAERNHRKPMPRPTGPQPCFRRPRGPGGRLLTPDEIASMQKVDGETHIAFQKQSDSSSGPSNVSGALDVTRESGQEAPARPDLKVRTAPGLEVPGMAAAAKHVEEHWANRRQMIRGRSRTRSGSRTRDDEYRYDSGRTGDEGYSDDSDFVVRGRIIRRVRSRSVSPQHKRHLAEGALAGAGAAALLTNHRDDIGTRFGNRGRQVVGGAALGAIGTEVLTGDRSRHRGSEGGARSQSRSRTPPHKAPDSAAEMSLPFIGYTFKRFDSTYAEFERVRLLNEKEKQGTSVSTEAMDVPKFDVVSKATSKAPINRLASPKSHFKSRIAAPVPPQDSDSALTQPQPKRLWWQAFSALQTLHPDAFATLTKELGSEAGIFPSDIPSDDVICTRTSSLITRLWTCMYEDKPSLAPIMAIRENIIKVLITIHQQLGLEIATLAWSCVWVFLSIHEPIFSSPSPLTTPRITHLTHAFQSLHDIVGIIARYSVMENLYSLNPSLTLKPEYQAALLDLCVTTLRYFDAAFVVGRKFAEEEGEVGREEGKVDGLVESIKGMDRACRNFAVSVEARDEFERGNESGNESERESEEAYVVDVSDGSWEQVSGDETAVDISLS